MKTTASIPCMMWICALSALAYGADAAPRTIPPATSLPVKLYGLPVGTEQTIEFDLPDDARNAAEVRLELEIDDIDRADEGSITLNKTHALSWAPALLGEGVHTGSIAVPPGRLRPGRNVFRFTFDSDLGGTTQGYIILKAHLRLDFTERAKRRKALAARGGAYRKAVLATPGLVTYLPLDAAEGSSTLDIAGDVDATLRACEVNAPGIAGKCVSFNQETSVLTVPGAALAARLDGARAISVEFWIAPGTDLALPQYVVMLRGHENYGSHVQLTGLTLAAAMRSAKEATPPIAGRVEAGRFNHVVLSADFEKGEMGLAVNGEISRAKRTFAHLSAQYTGTTTATTFGAGNDARNQPFCGYIDEIAVYRTALDDDTIRGHYEIARARAEKTAVKPIPPSLVPIAKIPDEKRLVLAPISSFCDWCHSYKVAFSGEGIQHIVQRHVQSGRARIVWRCTDGGTTAYFSKLREPFHGLQEENCHVDYFMTPDLDKYEKTDFRKLDSFAEVIERGHAAGLEVYAWVQVSGEDDAWGYASKRVREHPEVCTVGRDGKPFRAKLAWSMPENHEYLLGLLREILAYKPDGVILDFIKNQGDYRDQYYDQEGVVFYGYEAAAVDAFKEKTGKDPFAIPNSDPGWIQFRADYVTEFCRKARAMQRAEAPSVRWLAQIGVGKGRFVQYVKILDAKPGQRQYRPVQFAIREDALGGRLIDAAAWSREDLFDAIFPLTSPSGSVEAFREQMTITRDLVASGKSKLAAGAYIWGAAQRVAQFAHVAATEFNVDELYLAESLAFEPENWPFLKVADQLYGKQDVAHE